MILDINQNTPEWHELRQKCIGASDAPVIMQVSPWRTPYELWLQKLGLGQTETNSNMLRGILLEDKIRKKLTEQTGYNFCPKVVRSNEEPYIIASLDGLDADVNKAVEIKCPNRKDHEMALAGYVPEKYIPQLQHQMYVLEMDEIFYSSYFKTGVDHEIIDGTDIIYFSVKRDEKYIKELIQKEKTFFSYIEEMIPPPMTDKDYIIRNDLEWQTLAKNYIEMQQSRKYFEQQEEIIKRQIYDSIQGNNVKGFGLSVQKVIKKGCVDYKSIPGINDTDIEKYRKPNTQYYRFTVV